VVRSSVRARFVAKAFGVALALVVIVGAVVALRLGATVRGRLLVRASEIEARIGRRVTLGDVHVGLGATAFAEVRDIGVGPAEGAVGEAARPLLRIARIRLGLATMPLLRSGGRNLEVVSIDVDEPEITLVRLEGGGLSTDDVRERLRAAPPPPPSGARVTGVDRLTIQRGAFSLFDRTTPSAPPIQLEALRVDAASPSLDEPLSLKLEVGVSSKLPNLRVALDLAPVRTLAAAACPVRRAEIHLAPTTLAPFASYVTTKGADLWDATLGLDGLAECAGDSRVEGTAQLSGVRFVAADGPGSPPEMGAPVAVRLKGALRFDPASGDLVVPSFELALGQSTVAGSAEVRSATDARQVTKLVVALHADPDEILVALPASRRPRGPSVHGPVSVLATLERRDGRLRGPVDVEVADVGSEGGARTSLGLRGELAVAQDGDALGLSGASLRLGDRAEVEGSVELVGLRAAPRLAALSVTGKGRVEGVQALSPGAKRPGVEAAGPFTFAAEAGDDGEGIHAHVTADASRVAVRSEPFQKAGGVPLRVDLTGRQRGGAIEIERARLVVGDVAMKASGTGQDAQHFSARFDAEVPSLRSLIAFSKPAATRVPGDVTGDARALVSGTLERQGEVTDVHARVGLRDANLASPRLAVTGAGDLTAHVRAAGALLQTEVETDLTGRAFVPPGSTTSRPARRPRGPR
jgi:hypothetical protein